MGLTREEAYDFLELPFGVDQDSVRTSYKRLALKWHPDKHSGNPESLKKFKLVSKSYRKLTTGDNTDDMNLDHMIALFKEVFFARSAVNTCNGSGYDSSDDDDDDDDLEDDVRYSNIFPDKIKVKQDWKKAKAEEGDISGKLLSPEEIRKNAEELITEEEKEKRKAEKRKAKKKRRREKKKLEKVNDVDNMEDIKSSKQKTDAHPERTKKTDKKGDASTSSDEAGFDPNSAFFTKVVNKKKKLVPVVEPPAPIKHKKERGDKSDDEPDDLDPKTLRSRQLAIKGNEMAHLEHYTAAIELFSEAIKLDPNDFRFFGNRSYCYDRIQQYEKALKDADKAIHLSPDWPKGYFRRGRALAGLKVFPEAEKAFTQVLKLDKNCEDAVQELLRVRTHQIMEMGFTRQQSEDAIKLYGTVQSALDSLLAGVAENSLTGEVYVSDDDEGFIAAPQSTPVPSHTTQTSQAKMDPKNPDGLTALWVGNVLPEVTDKKLQQMFSRYGTVKSVRCLPEKYCAFVNFSTKEAAGKAMNALQSMECAGQRLLIKFPDNPIVNGAGSSHGTITLRKSTQKSPAIAPQAPATVTIGSAVKNIQKVCGPVNGDECYFWRTTGCSYGDKCRNSHLSTHKGVDKKAWQHS